ncbi:hypothetical protein KC366_g19095, partial [Hortaea werneckii]
MDDGGKSAEFPADAGGENDGVLGLSGQVGGKGSVPCPSSGRDSVVASSQALNCRGEENNDGMQYTEPVGAEQDRDAFGHKQAFGVHNGRADG